MLERDILVVEIVVRRDINIDVINKIFILVFILLS